MLIISVLHEKKFKILRGSVEFFLFGHISWRVNEGDKNKPTLN